MRIERLLYTLPLRLRSLFRRGRVEDELDQEFRDHLERQIQENISKGLTAQEARYAALRAMGGIEQRKEQCRDTRRVRVIEDLLQDLRYGLRMLRRSPGFTAVAVLSLALGIGANTAIFQLLDALRLAALPVEKPHELAQIRRLTNGNWPPGDYSGRYAEFTYPLWERIRANAQGFSGIFAWGNVTFDLASGGASRFAENGLWVSGDFFNVLGVQPILGRVFTASEDVRGCQSPGVVLSHSFWQRQFGGDRTVVGRKITVDGHPFEVIGVTPAGFFGVEVGRYFDLALPLCAEPILNGERSRLDRRSAWWLAAMGRLKAGSSLGQASAQLQSVSSGIFQETLPSGYNAEAEKNYLGFKLTAVPGGSGVSRLREEYDTPLRLLLAIAGGVLLIACANLANLMLARANAREREIAVRLALGASRGRLIRQLLTESLLIALFGAMCGAWLAPALSQSVVAMISSEVSPLFVDLSTNWRLLAFAASMAVLTCVLFGLAPALRATGVSPGESMKAAGRGTTTSRERFGLRRALVVVQMALSLVLLVAGLLFVRSFYNLLTVDAGFQQAGILEVDTDLTRLNLPAESRHGVHQWFIERIREIPGVNSVSSASTIPMVGIWSKIVYLGGSYEGRKGLSHFNRVSPDYFKTMRTPVLAGRDFDDRDKPASPSVAIVNESFAARFLNGANPLGTTFQLEGPSGTPERVYQIVGLVRDTKYRNLREEFSPIVYLTASQNDRPGPFGNILIRSNLTVAALMSSVKRTIEGTNPEVSFHFHDFQEQIRYSILQERLIAMLSGFFAVLAAVLATIGLYGVISYSVNQRTSEIGIRLALGADQRNIVRLILREAAMLLAIGLTAGAVLSLILARAAGTLLFGLQPNDPVTLVAAIALLAAVAAAASYLPARRASKSDPMVALRHE